MNAPVRKVPLHMRTRARQADLITENLRRVQEQRERNGIEPPPPPRTEMVNSRPTVIQEEPQPEEQQQPQSFEQQQEPEQQNFEQQQPEPQVQQQPLSAPELEQLRAENERLQQALNRSRQAQSADSVRANQLTAELTALRGQHGDLTRRLNALEAEQEDRRAAVIDDATIAAKFTTEQRKLLGDDQCRSIIATARSEAAAIVKRELKSQLAPIESRVQAATATTQRSRQSAIFADLDRNQSIKGWRQTDVDQDFQDWLTTTHPLTRRTYKQLLHEGFKLEDTSEAAAACAEIYLAYQSTKTSPPARTPRGAQPTSRPPAQGAGLPQRTAPELMTPPQMQALVREMRITRDPNRKAAIQKQLAEAQRQGLSR